MTHKKIGIPLKEHHFMIRKHVVINYTILTLTTFWKSNFLH